MWVFFCCCVFVGFFGFFLLAVIHFKWFHGYSSNKNANCWESSSINFVMRSRSGFSICNIPRSCSFYGNRRVVAYRLTFNFQTRHSLQPNQHQTYHACHILSYKRFVMKTMSIYLVSTSNALNHVSAGPDTCKCEWNAATFLSSEFRFLFRGTIKRFKLQQKMFPLF